MATHYEKDLTRSNSDAARRGIDKQLAVCGIHRALRGLRALGTLRDVFHRTRASER